MPTNRVPKAIQSRTLAQSVFVNLVAQLLLSFSQPMLAQSQQRPFPSGGQNSQAVSGLCEADVMNAVSPREMEQGSRACAICANDLAGPKRVDRPQRKEVAYVDAMLSPL
jgi:hypothetical protein